LSEEVGLQTSILQVFLKKRKYFAHEPMHRRVCWRIVVQYLFDSFVVFDKLNFKKSEENYFENLSIIEALVFLESIFN